MRATSRQDRTAARFAATLILVGFAALLVLYAQPRTSTLERVLTNGTLVVAMRSGPASYFPGANGPDGFEYALIEAFAQHLGVRLEAVFPPTLQALLDATQRHQVHMAAAGLSVTPEREQRLRFGLPYAFVTEQLIYRRGSPRPRSLEEIGPGDLHVVAGSSHEERLARLRANRFPELTWQSHPESNAERLLADLDQGLLRATVADSLPFALSRRIFRHAAVAFDLAESKPVAWAFGRGGDDSLREAADRFLGEFERSGGLARLHARYFGHVNRMNFVDTRQFWRHVRDRLPQYQRYFEEAAAETGIDWRLLAAIGYQESHWRPEAVSPTGVRGIMMLTRAAARQVGIKDRRDPEQSIRGGARYLRLIEEKIPERILEPNRLWLTLAGYNVGFGHLEDARVLTQREGANPDLWMDVKQRLPLLSKKAYYSTLRYGFARGQEPVDYVDNIRNYYDLLIWYTTTRDCKALERLTEDQGAPPDLRC
jgi:membrane-bound lytic murein transglycosylase F